jgi:hypothetical protein
MRVLQGMCVLGGVLGLLAASASYAEPRREAILAQLVAQARREPGFTGFSAERGAAFYTAKHQGGKPNTPSCSSCHGKSPHEKGKTRVGKDIDPMAVSKTPARYTDPENVEKWFARNCNDVLGRPCTAREKGDFITYMVGQ